MRRRLSTASAWLALRAHAAPRPQPWRPWRWAPGRFPRRRPWARRLAAWPQSVPGLLGGLGRPGGPRRRPWARPGRAVAGARPPLAPGGGVWQTTPRAQGGRPQRARETAAGWRQAGWPGGWEGWQRPRAVTAGARWRPWAAALPVAPRGDHAEAPWWREPWPPAGRCGRGATPSQRPAGRQEGQPRGGAGGAPRRGPSPRREGGAAGRHGGHQRRAPASEPCQGLWKHSGAGRGPLPVNGRQRAPWLAWGAGVIEQLGWLDPQERHLP
jgi:hypothetical protein